MNITSKVKLTVLLCLFSVNSSLFADGVCDAQAIYEKLDAEFLGDTSRCSVQIKEPLIKECPLPQTFTAGDRPASHVVLLMDASGSMGAKLRSKTKMSIAKHESSRFLEALQKDIPVGMIVYGHKGDNTKKGKAESCASVEWVHQLGASKSSLKKSINALKPVGYTPMGDALDYTLTELQKLKKSKEKKASIPIVYLLSDGKETCGGDPVASAKALHESGVKAVVNVIGFDVGKETRDQLKAISDAGGGKYFPAKDAVALRKQLNAARDTEASLYRYENCLFANFARTVSVHNNALQDAVKCHHNELTKPFRRFKKHLRKMVSDAEIDKNCSNQISLIANQKYVKEGQWLLQENKKIRAHQDVELDKLTQGSVWQSYFK